MKKGFTLLEVLIVVAIMGLLLSIMLVNMGQARDKGRDAALKSTLSELRNAAELYHDQIGTYTGICDSGTLVDSGDFGRIENFINDNNGNGVMECLDSDLAYAVIVSLNTEDCWCVDNQGSSKGVSLGMGETCPDKLITTQCP